MTISSYINNFKILVVLVVIVSSLGGFLYWDNRESRILRSQVRDLQLQLAESEQKCDTFVIRDSIPVWKERIVEVDRTDYKQVLADRALLKELELKISEIEAENRMLLGTRDTVYLSLGRDSVLRYSDKWADFAYYEDRKRLEYAVRDSISTIIARDYKHRFLWWRWGTKGYTVYIVNHNPRSRIYYNKYIRVKK